MHRLVERLLVTVMSLAACAAMANNVVVTIPDLKSLDSSKVTVQFNLSWDNSWRDGTNYDACWVFVKYSTNSGATWSHATLAGSGTNPAGFASGTGSSLEIVVPSDKKGAFIQRSAAGAGAGTVSNVGVQLAWDFAANGISKSQNARVKVFAIEMVHVPQGSFYAGDGTTTTIEGQFEDGTNGAPFLVTNESYTITLGGGGVGSMGNNNHAGMLNPDDFGDGASVTLPAAFPKGYAGFYLMKTELSQKQYCDFLNALTGAQQSNRCDSAMHFKQYGYRNFMKKTSGFPAVFGCDAGDNAGPATAVTNVALLNETNDGVCVVCDNLSWMDGAAYSEWAALRPVTELEFEKACRGPLSAVADEYAWGNTNLEAAPASLIGSGTASETPNQGNCNYGAATPDGQYRCGCFARASSSRQNAGAGYYGALDLAGSMWESTVAVGNSTGRGFTGTHGNGNLSVNGNAHQVNWPGYSGGEITGSAGTGLHGGNWGSGSANLRVSDRIYAGYPPSSRGYGWRAGRTAP